MTSPRDLFEKCAIPLKYRNALKGDDDDSIVPLCRALDIKRYQVYPLEAIFLSASILFSVKIK